MFHSLRIPLVVMVMFIVLWNSSSLPLHAEGPLGRTEVVAHATEAEPFQEVFQPAIGANSETIGFMGVYGNIYQSSIKGVQPLTFERIPNLNSLPCLGESCDPITLSFSANGAYGIYNTSHYTVECGPRWCDTHYFGDSARYFDTATYTHHELLFGTQNPRISDDGNLMLYSAGNQIFLYNIPTATSTLVSRTPAGTEGNGASSEHAFSADGQTVVFTSAASDLVADDTNGVSDIFLYERATNTVSRLSTTGAEQGNGASRLPSIDPVGRFVVFSSAASNLVANDTNSVEDVFLKDLQNGTVVRISITHDGQEANGASTVAGVTSDGNRVVFVSAATNLVADDLNGVDDIFVRTLSSQSTRRISVSSGKAEGSKAAHTPLITGNGRYIAFMTESRLQASDTDNITDLYVHDWMGRTYRINETFPLPAAVDGMLSTNSISADGTYIAYRRNTLQSNLLFNRTTHRHTPFASTADLHYSPTDTPPAISANGNYLVGLEENDSAYRYERVSGERVLVSVLPNGNTTSARRITLSGNGNVVAFSVHGNLIYARNITTGITMLVSHIQDSESAIGGALSDLNADGSLILYNTEIGALPESPDALHSILYDTTTQTGELVTLTENGDATNGDSQGTSISGDGRYVTFLSTATNVTQNDQNGIVQDLFLRDRVANTTTLLSKDFAGNNAHGRTANGVLSHNGRYLAIATSLVMVEGDTNNGFDVYRVDLESGEILKVSEGNGIRIETYDSYDLAVSDNGVVAFPAQALDYFPELPYEADDKSLFAYDATTPDQPYRLYAPLAGR